MNWGAGWHHRRGWFLTTMGLAFLMMFQGCGEKDDGGAGGVEGDPTPIDNSLPPPENPVEIDARSYFPVGDDLRWRYQKQRDEQPEMVALEDLSESEMSAGENAGEYVRTTVAFSELDEDGTPVLARQVFQETFVVEPAVEMVGPKVRIKSVRVIETAVADDRRLRTIDRVYEPPYRFISDAWRTGQFDTRIVDTETRLVQTVFEAGDEEPRETTGLVTLEVETSVREHTIMTPGGYREGVREIKVTDDFSGMTSRTYWVERGVGVVQWRFRATDYTRHMLVDHNFDQEMEPTDGEESP